MAHHISSDMCSLQIWIACDNHEVEAIQRLRMATFPLRRCISSLSPYTTDSLPFKYTAQTRTSRYPGANRHEAFLHLGNAIEERVHPLFSTHAQAPLWLHVKNQPSERHLLIRSQTLQGRYAGNLAPQGILRLKQLKLWSIGPEYLRDNS